MTRKPRKPSADATIPRLQKVLATAGYGSRRQCEELIVMGRVEVDRQVVAELGARVDPDTQQIRVDGVPLKLPKQKHFMLHKPVGVVSTARDPWARTRVIDLVADNDRLFTVGRLDKSSSGLILVTNDGDLAHQLTHPKFGVEKVYRVIVAGCPTADTLRQLRTGVYLAEGKARVERVVVKKTQSSQSELEIVLAEGRNREIRRLLARFGHKVQQLKRVALGPIRLGDLPTGAYRELSRSEVTALREAAAGGGPTPAGDAQTRRQASPKSSARRPDRSGSQRSKSTAGAPARPKANVGKPRKQVRIAPAAMRLERETAGRRPPDPRRKKRPSSDARQGTILGADTEFIVGDIPDGDAPLQSERRPARRASTGRAAASSAAYAGGRARAGAAGQSKEQGQTKARRRPGAHGQTRSGGPPSGPKKRTPRPGGKRR